MKPNISIIICTRNRADDLKATLQSLEQANVPKDKKVELLVVDNGSVDHTQKVVREAGLTKIDLRYVCETKAGQSQARNCGLRESSGDIILFTDDDLRFPPDWIAGMCGPIITGEADAVAGGVIFPSHINELLSASPISSLRGWVASTEEIHPIRPDRMVGANMAFHRRVLGKVPGFDVELGPGALGFNDETLFSSQLLAAGFRIAGALNVAVEHHFNVTRLTSAGTLDMAQKMGRSRAFIFHHWEHERSRLIAPRLIIGFLQRFLWIHLARLGGEGRSRTAEFRALMSEEQHAFSREYLVQRKRSRKYSRHGLIALHPNS